jgi:hypothetical protein
MGGLRITPALATASWYKPNGQFLALAEELARTARLTAACRQSL